MNCVVCHQALDPALAPELSHPACSSNSFYDDLDERADPFNVELKQRLLEMILYASRQDPRSQQKEIGPSEMGDVCDRRIAYRLAEVPEVNTAFDPWPSTVGTAIHAWLRGGVDLWDRHHSTTNWATEREIPFDFGLGHGDLYREDIPTVIDWKSASKDVMRKVGNSGPPPHYVVQIHLYGYGYRKLGKPVERVALAFVPRSGWIKDMIVWSEPYNEQVAIDAINRMYSIAQHGLSLQLAQHPHRWQQIPATSSDSCGMCPWYNSLRTDEQGASDQGCPGH